VEQPQGDRDYEISHHGGDCLYCDTFFHGIRRRSGSARRSRPRRVGGQPTAGPVGAGLASALVLGEPQRRGAVGILDLEPAFRPARPVGVLAVLRDALEAQLAGVNEDGRSVPCEVLVELDPGGPVSQEFLKARFSSVQR